MSGNQNDSSLVKPKLGLMGAAMNAMALIAPGAFLWITYQMQAAATAPSGASVAGDLWAGIALALAVCFLTALSYSELAKIYPEAGFASCTYFAEKAFLDARKEKVSGPTSIAHPQTCLRLSCSHQSRQCPCRACRKASRSGLARRYRLLQARGLLASLMVNCHPCFAGGGRAAY